MIVRKLPAADTFIQSGQTPVFSDHIVFTETTKTAYRMPEHIPGTGLLTMRSGAGHCTVNRQKEILDDRHFLIVAAHSRLSIDLPNPGARPLFLFFDSRLAKTTADERGADWRWVERAHPLTDPLRQWLDWLAGMQDNSSSFAALKSDSIIRSIWEDISARALAAAELSSALPVSTLGTRIRLFKRLSLAREWIVSNYASPMTLLDMSKIATLNSQHFLRMFRHCFGVTPHHFLRNTRLEMARRALVATAEPVSVICRVTGFESLSSFSWLFRQQYGKSPTTYRLSRSIGIAADITT